MIFFLNSNGYPSIGKFVRVWGVSEESVSYTVSQACNGGGGGPNLTFNVSWNTSIKSTGVDTLHVYSPAGTCGSGSGNPTPSTPPPGGSFTHQASKAFACQNGTWKLVVKSHESGSTSKSSCRTVQVTCMSCCPPPGCEIE